MKDVRREQQRLGEDDREQRLGEDDSRRNDAVLSLKYTEAYVTSASLAQENRLVHFHQLGLEEFNELGCYRRGSIQQDGGLTGAPVACSSQRTKCW